MSLDPLHKQIARIAFALPRLALCVVAADSPELRRVETHSRTIALVILLSGAEPK